MILPVVALVAWSLVVWVWMGATRVPAMQKARLHPEEAKHTRSNVFDVLPTEVRRVADNYNHLMEQPTIFYAVALAMAVGGVATSLDVGLAWGYVALRIVHSGWQILVNKVVIRFYLFVASTLLLFPLAIRAAYALLTRSAGA